MQERRAVPGMFFQRQVAHSPTLVQTFPTPVKLSATGMGPHSPGESVRSCWNVRQSWELVFLLPASREHCPHAANLWLVCADTSPSESLSLDALTTVPLSLILTARVLCCSHPHRLGGIPQVPPPVQEQGFASILLLSDRLSHTEINPADITACSCPKKKRCMWMLTLPVVTML